MRQRQNDRLEQRGLQSNGLHLTGEINHMYGSKFVDQHAAGCYAGCLKCAGCLPISLCCLCSACGCGPIKEVKQGYMGLLVELGKLKRKLGPGLHSYNPCTEKIVTVDLRVQSMNTPEQKLLTKDSVTVWIDVFVNFRILVPELALFKIANYYQFLTLTVESVMKSIVAERTLVQLLGNRKEIEKSTTTIMDEKVFPYGIDVTSIETQSIRLPMNMERAMATVAESEKASEAKQVKAKGSLESARAFRLAADELGKNPLSLELKYFETMKEVARDTPSLLFVTDSYASKVRDMGRTK